MTSTLNQTAPRPAREPELLMELDVPLPRVMAPGGATALFVCGWCFSPTETIRDLSIVVDGEPQPVMAHGMPRLDLMRSLHPDLDAYETSDVASDPASLHDPALHSYRSGFWGMARIAERRGAACELELRATFASGATGTVPLATIAPAEVPCPLTAPAPAPGTGPLVGIAMATYEPPVELLRAQLESVREQTHRNWICVISDDHSSPERWAALQSVVGDDPRFLVSRAPRRLGFYRNFERALRLVPREARYVAMADQDDHWHPDKLEALLAAIGDARLIYSDARIVGPDGAVRSETYWTRRRNNHSNMLSLLVSNAVTGAASLFPRDLLDDALPFPPDQFGHFHDHWLALVALSLGDIAYVPRPLYDYVQHGDASFGHARANRITTVRDRLAHLRKDPRERVRLWRMHYFGDVARLLQFATVLRLRFGDRIAPRKRRALDRFLATDRSMRSLATLWLRGARELVGRPETLGTEWMLAYAFSWRRLLAATTRDRPVRLLRLDAVPPGGMARFVEPDRPASPAVDAMAEKIAPLRLAVRGDAPLRVNLLLPTIDVEHFFGGYIAKLNLARRLAERGLRVRIVTVDPQATPQARTPSPRRVEAYDGLAGLFDRVEVAFGREATGLRVNPSDRFVATTWWSAHIAAAALRELGGGRFLYLIQEYEPLTFPMGSYAALAEHSYRLPHRALFSTELLRDHFRGRGIGVYADGRDAGDAASLVFENAITRVEAPSVGELARRASRRLLFYARPEAHAARNMFELGVLALRRASADGALDGWELHGIGALESGHRVDLAGGTTLELLPRAAQGDYARILRDHDVGLALMYTPHPSLVPIEMASAGMLTVTNRFENKTAEALAAISPNILAAEPSVEGVAEALREAVAGVTDAERRVRGSAVRWCCSWDEAFDDALLDRVMALLDR